MKCLIYHFTFIEQANKYHPTTKFKAEIFETKTSSSLRQEVRKGIPG